ncbi:Uncharacterised protein [Sphingobacterium multivorum]|uniref:hypothetical protein n=1 Tax=Sphingobacterium multivorum TaxID=28454 RepID=UPI000DFB1516|nr:hypothetical protein [Sphingobacterium multivorum]QQT44915.1 hypothetical protein I6J00_25000 [Sphingobacterium multivorum]SUJ18393.1 Uncharacterised protein [Sphingobacterium multivorum]
MRTAKEFLRQFIVVGYDVHEPTIIAAMKEFALEVAKEALKNAAENATITGNWDSKIGDVIHSVDKESILSHDNIPEL